MLTPIIVALILTPQLCNRCHNNPAMDWQKAIPIAAKRAKLPIEQEAMKGLILREHGWDTPSRFAQNRNSTAYGLGQFLNGTWKGVGIKKTSCAVCQIEGIYYYCKNRKEYGSVSRAVAKWDSRARNPPNVSRHSTRKPRGGWY